MEAGAERLKRSEPNNRTLEAELTSLRLNSRAEARAGDEQKEMLQRESKLLREEIRGIEDLCREGSLKEGRELLAWNAKKVAGVLEELVEAQEERQQAQRDNDENYSQVIARDEQIEQLEQMVGELGGAPATLRTPPGLQAPLPLGQGSPGVNSMQPGPWSSANPPPGVGASAYGSDPAISNPTIAPSGNGNVGNVQALDGAGEVTDQFREGIERLCLGCL